MAESDRQRLLARALALPTAAESDFFGDRRPPEDADPELLKRIDDTTLRTKLVETRIAEGLQSPKGPQKIASILRIYPDFDAPSRTAAAPRAKASASAPAPQAPRGLPSIDQMERLLARYREIERDVAAELSSDADERIARLKRALADLDGTELEAAYRELGQALERKRARARAGAGAQTRARQSNSFRDVRAHRRRFGVCGADVFTVVGARRLSKQRCLQRPLFRKPRNSDAE